MKPKTAYIVIEPEPKGSSATPRTDAESKRFNTVDSFDDKDTIPADFARQLETELTQAEAMVGVYKMDRDELTAKLQAAEDTSAMLVEALNEAFHWVPEGTTCETLTREALAAHKSRIKTP